jgi:hypothetical protein
MNAFEPIKENEGIGFTYTVTMEQMEKHAALSPEEVFQWIEEIATFIYELQTPEERNRKFDFKPNKKIPAELLRKDGQ